MNKYVSSGNPRLIFSTVEAAKSFAEKLDLEHEVVEYLRLSDDEQQCVLIGYVILTNGRLFQ